MVVIVDERTGRILAECDSITEAEDLIAVFEQVDPDNVHAGHYGIDADEAAYIEYQKAARDQR